MNPAEKKYQEAMNAGHSAAWDLDWRQAATYYRQALEAKLNDYQALTSLGLALFEQHAYEEALQAYIQAAKTAPQEPVPWEKMAQIHERQGNLQLAVQAALQAADRFMRRGEVKRGVDNYLRVLRLEPQHLTAHSHLALIYDRLKQIDRAVEEYLAVAALLQRQGKVQEAIQAAKRAAALVPDDPKVRQALAALANGTPLPLPKRPRGGTNPLRMAKIREATASTREAANETDTPTEEEPEGDPIAQAQQRALTRIAEVLFEQAEQDTDEGPTDRPSGLDALVRGLTNPTDRRQQRRRILLLLGQVVDEQTRGNYAQAAEELRRALDAGLDHAAAYFDYGFLLMETGQPQEALQYLQRAMPHPDFALASHLLAGRAYRQIGKPAEAAQHYLEALRLADMTAVPPEHADALGQLYEPIIAQVGSEDDREVLQRIAENVEQLLGHPDWHHRVRQAREQLLQSRPGDALLPLADMMLEAQSGRIVDALERVHDLMAQGAWGAALEEAQLALAYAPAYLPLHILMADILVQRGLLEAAEEKYLAVARTYLIRGNAQRAVELYRKVLDINPTRVDAHRRLIEALIRQNKLEEAIAHYMEMADGYYQLADLQQAAQTYEEALRLARRLPNGRVWQLQILRQLADLAEQRLDWRQAALFYEQIRTLEPEDEEVRTKLIDLHLRLGRVPQAVAELDDYLQHLQHAGKADTALTFLRNLSEAHPHIGELQLLLGRLYNALGQKQQAMAAYDAAGEKFLDERRIEDAIQAIEAILALEPPDAEAYRQALTQLREQAEG